MGKKLDPMDRDKLFAEQLKTSPERDPVQWKTRMQKAALYTSGVIFALAHGVRLITGIEILVAGVAVPLWGVQAASTLADRRAKPSRRPGRLHGLRCEGR